MRAAEENQMRSFGGIFSPSLTNKHKVRRLLLKVDSRAKRLNFYFEHDCRRSELHKVLQVFTAHQTEATKCKASVED